VFYLLDGQILQPDLGGRGQRPGKTDSNTQKLNLSSVTTLQKSPKVQMLWLFPIQTKKIFMIHGRKN